MKKTALQFLLLAFLGVASGYLLFPKYTVKMVKGYGLVKYNKITGSAVYFCRKSHQWLRFEKACEEKLDLIDDIGLFNDTK